MEDNQKSQNAVMSNPAAGQPQKVHLRLDGQAAPGGLFEITCITAGTGNGWNFPAELLRSSILLWDGVECFMDHVGRALNPRPGRAGVCAGLGPGD